MGCSHTLSREERERTLSKPKDGAVYIIMSLWVCDREIGFAIVCFNYVAKTVEMSHNITWNYKQELH